MQDRQKAKDALDTVIKKSRIHFYKPIQIAEILYHIRIGDKIDPLNLEDYRTRSKKWRDDITNLLIGRICTSSAKFQDNLFEENAVPPAMLNELSKENLRTGGAVEAYIYNCFNEKHSQLHNALSYCYESTKEDFDVKRFINSFRKEPGLKRSVDKIYEIVVYSLFATLVETLGIKVKVSVPRNKFGILDEFDDFSEKIMSLDFDNPIHTQDAHVYRLGVTNAADRGLDMYSNWGPAIQIKHLNLDEDLAKNIVSSVSSDKIVIVCKGAKKPVIDSLLNQTAWKSRIQSIVTEHNLVNWYEKALRGKYGYVIGDKLLKSLINEIANEFLSVRKTPNKIKSRHYENITDPFWTLPKHKTSHSNVLK